MKNILNFFIILFSLIIINYSVFAAQVDINTAKIVAKNCLYENISFKNTVDYNTINISESFSIKNGSDIVYYVFNFTNGGFVIVSAEDNLYPIIGYSLKNKYINENQPDNFSFWMKHYSDEIAYTKKMKSASNPDIVAKWNHYLSKPVISPNNSKTIIVPQLLSCTWDQGLYYNAMCPADAGGVGGHVYTGCVATAMAQIMFYYRYPETGIGTHTDHSQTYGNLVVNCGATTYDWNAMLDALTNFNNAVATLIYQAGVTVNMNYSTSGSGASMHSAASAYTSHFGYGTVTDNDRSNFTVSSWTNKIIGELNAGRPVLYSGDDSIDGGHAFVCDGYDSNNNFHFNWGWSGYYDGYYTLADLNPGNQDHFNSNQELLTGIYPGSGYPYYCSGTTNIISPEGTIEDGSGPGNYNNNGDCRWLISPPNAGVIHLYFTAFETEASNDQVIIYDGSSTSDSVLAVYSGNSIPNSVTTTGHSMLIRFVTNSTTTSAGWRAVYSSTVQPLCASLTDFTTPTGNFSDGSGSNNYLSSTYCDWKIDPPGAVSITLGFTSFSLGTGDKVRIYDIAQSPTVLLATFTGTTIPSTATYNTGQLVVVFSTTSTGTGPGWDAFYNAVISKIDKNNIESSLNIYPNPAENLLHVDFYANNSQPAELILTSVVGQNVYNKQIDNLSGNYTGTIDISNFAKGIYFLKIVTASGTVTRKIVIQ